VKGEGRLENLDPTIDEEESLHEGKGSVSNNEIFGQ